MSLAVGAAYILSAFALGLALWWISEIVSLTVRCFFIDNFFLVISSCWALVGLQLFLSAAASSPEMMAMFHMPILLPFATVMLIMVIGESTLALKRYRERIVALETETEKLKTKNKELERTEEEQAMLWRSAFLNIADVKNQFYEDEKKKLEMKVEQMGKRRVAVTKALKILEKEKEEMLRQLEEKQNRIVAAEKLNVFSFKSQASAEKELKAKECENRTLGIEKIKMQTRLARVENQLEKLNENLSLEQNKCADVTKEQKRVINKLESLNKLLTYEQGQRKAAEEELAMFKRLCCGCIAKKARGKGEPGAGGGAKEKKA